MVPRNLEGAGMAYPAVHQGNLEDGNRGEDRAYREEGMAWEDAVAKEVPLENRRSGKLNRSSKVEYVLGGIMPIPRPAGAPRPGPNGS